MQCSIFVCTVNCLCTIHRCWEAVKHYDEALQWFPTLAVLHEMKSKYVFGCVVCMHKAEFKDSFIAAV